MRHNHLWVPPTSCLIMLQFFKIVLSCPTPLLQISPFSELRISHSNAKRSSPQAIWLQLLPTLFLLFKSIVFYFLSNRFNHKTCSVQKRSKQRQYACRPFVNEDSENDDDVDDDDNGGFDWTEMMERMFHVTTSSSLLCVHDEKFIQLLSFCSRSKRDDDDDGDDEEEERRKIIQDEADNSFSKWQCVKLFWC